MTLPTINPSWATDTLLISGPDTGLETKETPDPSAGVIAQGFIPGAILPASRLNWILNVYGQWLAYFGGNITDRLLTIPVWQAMHGTQAAGGTVGWAQYIAAGTSPFLTTTTGGDDAHILLPLSDLLPDGAQVSEVSVGVTTGAARTGTDRMAISAHTFTLDATLIPGALSLAGPVGYDDGTASNQRLTSLITYTVDRSTRDCLVVTVKAGNDAGTNPDTVYGFEVKYTGPPSLR